MEQIVITHPDKTKTLLNSRAHVSGITKAEQKVNLLGDDLTEITVESATPLDFALGDTIEVFGKTYTLNLLPTIKKTGKRKFSYELTFEGVQYELLDVQYLLPDNTTGDSYTGNLQQFLSVLIQNVIRVFPGKWIIGDFPTNTEVKTLSYSGQNCLSVLQQLCQEYKQEFEIEQKNGVRILHIRKAGVNFPYTFHYGKTGGLYELTRKNINSKNVVTRLYVYGGSNNLGSKYRYSKLCLPGKNKNASYIENAAAIAAFGIKENTKTFDEIFPNRYGKVTGKGLKYYAFVDTTMNFDLNEKDSEGNTKWLVEGVNAKVKFTTGNLAGYEFDVHKYDHTTKEIQVVPFTDENGMKFPSETSAAFQFGIDDKYFFTDINLPDAYKTEAENELSTEGTTYYNQNCQPQAEYGLNIDQNFIKQFASELTVVNLFAVGDYIPVEDLDIGLDKSIRITGFTRDLLQPYKYSLTLGDSITKSSYTRIISDLTEIDRIIEINNLSDPAKARRNWKASQEVLAMVFDPEGKYYSEKIKPLSIETTMLAVGAKSMQFILKNIIFTPNYSGNPNLLSVSSGQLVHYTIEENIRTWNIGAVSFNNLVSATAYYIYARCTKANNAANIVLSTNQITVDSDPLYYYFLIGVLNSVTTDADGSNPARLISLTYGGSTINGRFIKTGRIESSGGSSTYFDLDNGEIGGNIKIKAGSSGYSNLSDKPNLSIYATTSELNVLNDKITAQVTRVDNLTTRIDTAGWITKATANTLYAAKTLENGQTIISYINQTAGSTTIHSSKINLEGAVTIKSLDSDLQGKLNNTISKADLGAMAFKDAVEYAQLGSTIVVGGYLNTDLIKVRRIDATAGFIGGFTLENGRLIWTRSDYFGGTSRSLKLGSGTAKEGVVNITFNIATDGKFGVSSCGSNLGGACIYASTKDNEGSRNYPNINNTYAGYFDGGVHVNGNVYCGLILANEIGTSWSLGSNGTYTYSKGLTKTITMAGGVRWNFINGILVSYG